MSDFSPRAADVSAALIWRGDRFFICRRPANKARALLWEFPGGKAEQGETPERALERECLEELGIPVIVKSEFASVVYEYPDITVRLTLFDTLISEGEPVLLEHAGSAWISAGEIGRYEFCPADIELLEAIRKKDALFGMQKKTLDTFLSTGAIDVFQYEKSLKGLAEKLRMSGRACPDRIC